MPSVTTRNMVCVFQGSHYSMMGLPWPSSLPFGYELAPEPTRRAPDAPSNSICLRMLSLGTSAPLPRYLCFSYAWASVVQVLASSLVSLQCIFFRKHVSMLSLKLRKSRASHKSHFTSLTSSGSRVSLPESPCWQPSEHL